jgi:DNA-binding NarL/FixJ family response regulator
MVRDGGAGPVQVLIVDDDPRVRTALRAFLTAHPGVDVIGDAGTGTVALELAREKAPTVAVMDIYLPAMSDGLALLRVFSQDLGIPVIAISLEAGVRQDALAAGAFCFLDKASVPEQLVEALLRRMT